MSEYTAPPESPEASVKAESADAREGVSEHDLLLMAVEAISRMTDNVAFRTVVEKALEERAAAAE